MAATVEPAATAACFPALWQKVTLSLAGCVFSQPRKMMEGDGGGEQELEEEVEQ